MFQGKYTIKTEPAATLCQLAAKLLLDFVCSKKPDLLGSYIIPPAKAIHIEDQFVGLRFERTWFVHTTDATSLSELCRSDKLGKIRFRVTLKSPAEDEAKAYFTSIFCRADKLQISSDIPAVVKETAECLPINNDWLIAANDWVTGKTQDEIATGFTDYLESISHPLFTNNYTGFVPPTEWKPQPPPLPVYLVKSLPAEFPHAQLNGRTIQTTEYNTASGILEIVFSDTTRLLVKPETFSHIALATKKVAEESQPKQYDPFQL